MKQPCNNDIYKEVKYLRTDMRVVKKNVSGLNLWKAKVEGGISVAKWMGGCGMFLALIKYFL